MFAFYPLIHSHRTFLLLILFSNAKSLHKGNLMVISTQAWSVCLRVPLSSLRLPSVDLLNNGFVLQPKHSRPLILLQPRPQNFIACCTLTDMRHAYFLRGLFYKYWLLPITVINNYYRNETEHPNTLDDPRVFATTKVATENSCNPTANSFTII